MTDENIEIRKQMVFTENKIFNSPRLALHLIVKFNVEYKVLLRYFYHFKQSILL